MHLFSRCSPGNSGGFKFYERAEIKTIIDYLRVIHQPDNNDALLRIINVPRRGVGDATLKALVDECERGGFSLWKLLLRICREGGKSNLKPQVEMKIDREIVTFVLSMRKRLDGSEPPTIVQLIEQILEHTNYQKYLLDKYDEQHEQRWANVQEFIQLASDFELNASELDEDELPEVEDLEQDKETGLLGRFLANVSLAADAQKGDKDQENKPMVTISTIHAAKGLEWPVVFIPSVYSGSIPHSRSDDFAEERRLLFVAMTRAKALLYLSCPAETRQTPRDLSEFLEDIPKNHFESRGPTFDHKILSDIGRIIDRAPPSAEELYQNMALCADQFEEPQDRQDRHWRTHGGVATLDESRYPLKRLRGYEDSGPDSDRIKRLRQQYESTSAGFGNVNDVHWRQGYATTMDRSSEFTISSAMPGFVSAGAHSMAMAAVRALSKPQQGQPASKPGKASSNVSGTQSRLTFAKPDAGQAAARGAPPSGNSDGQPAAGRDVKGAVLKALGQQQGKTAAAGMGGGAAAAKNQQQQQQQGRQTTIQHTQKPYQQHNPPEVGPPRLSQCGQPQTRNALQQRHQQLQSIEPALADHKIGGVKPPPYRPQNQQKWAEPENVPPAKAYHWLSSSPEKATNAVDGSIGQPTTVQTVPGRGPLAGQSRTASTFHTTTTQALSQNRTGPNALKNPVGPAKPTMAPMDRLRKPFKPLTMNR